MRFWEKTVSFIKCLNRLVNVCECFIEGTPKKIAEEDQIIVSIFITPDNKIKIHDVMGVEMDAQLLALSLPYVVTLQKLNIVRDIMSDFDGLEDCSQATKEAIIDFSYHLSIGKLVLNKYFMPFAVKQKKLKI